MSKELKSIKFPGLPDAYFVPETSGDDFSFDPTAYELPVLLLNGNSEGISKDNEVNLNYSLNDKSGSCTLKWQGSSSLAYEKKNYTIKFDNAFEAVEGWGEQNKYCLKANWIDHSHSRNIVSAKLWGEMVKSRTSLLGWNAEYDIYHDDAYSYANGVLTSLTNVVNDGGRFLADFILPEGGFNVTCDVYFPEGATDLTATLCMHRKDTNVSAFVQKSVSAAGKWETVTFSEIWTAGSASFISLQGQNTTGVKFRNIRVDGLYNLVGTTYHYSPVEQIKSLPNGGAVDGFPVVVMLNDEFHGLYTFNIPKDGWMFGLVEDTTKKQAVVGANNHTDATWFKSTAELDERDFELEFVSDGYNSDWVLYSLNTLINACISSDGSDLDTTVAQYLDWKSAIDYLIFIVLLDGSDMVSKNYLLTTLDGRKWFFTAYDMDSTYGLHWDASGLSDAVAGVSFSGCVYHRVFELIMNYKFEELKARYNELRQTILSEHNICEAFENFAWAIPSPVLMEDIKRHSTIKGSSVNDIDQICRWVQQRLEVVDKWVNGETISNGTKFVEVLYKNGVYSLVDATYESILADISQGIDVRLELNGGTWIKRYCLVLDYSMNSNVGNRYLLFSAGNSTTIDDLVIKPDNTVRRDTGKSVTDARTINGYKLNENITLTASDVGAYSKEEIDSKGYLTESDKQEIAEQAAQMVEIPEVNFDGYATEEFVKNKITEAELGGEDVDLSGYAQRSDIPTKVSQLENDKGYLTEHQDISGKLNTSELPAAINTALSQAKASGEFDGKNGQDGQDGYTPQKNVDYFDGKDGKDGSNGKDGTSATHSWNGTTLTITSASGTSSANLKGDKGDAGKTPVKGTDYFTESDKQEMVSAVLAALPTAEGASF